jgi:hypothetical protein
MTDGNLGIFDALNKVTVWQQQALLQIMWWWSLFLDYYYDRRFGIYRFSFYPTPGNIISDVGIRRKTEFFRHAQNTQIYQMNE